MCETSTFEGVAKSGGDAVSGGRVRDERAPALYSRAAAASAGNRQLTVPTAITAGLLRLATAVAAPPGHEPPTTASSAGCAPPPDDRRHRRQCRRHHQDPEGFFLRSRGTTTPTTPDRARCLNTRTQTPARVTVECFCARQ